MTPPDSVSLQSDFIANLRGLAIVSVDADGKFAERMG
jgi:hypothetical protein